MSKSNFVFAMTAEVRIICSRETGEIVGRSEFKDGRDAYLVRYKAADGRAVEQWWNEDALEHIDQ